MTVLHRITGVLVFRYMGSQLRNFGNCNWKPVPPSRDVMCTHSIKTQWFIHILICLLISAFIIYAVYTIVVCKEHCWVLMTIHSLDEEVYKMMRERDDSNPDLLFTISVEGCCFLSIMVSCVCCLWTSQFKKWRMWLFVQTKGLNQSCLNFCHFLHMFLLLLQ